MTPTADLLRLRDVVDLAEDAPVDVALLGAAVAATDVDLGTFTDEELHWASPDADAAPAVFVDAPRLGLLRTPAQEVALETTMWLLQARGEADWDGERLMLRGAHALVGQVRHEAEASVTVQSKTRDAVGQQAALYRLTPELFVVEYVAPEGLHRLVCCSADRAAVRLASLVDPQELARDTGAVRRGEDLQASATSAEALAASASTAAFVLLGELDRNGAVVQRAVTVYGSDEGVHVHQGEAAPAGDAVLAVQRLSPVDLVGYCRWFLARGGVA
jgi:hypothetical protein